MVRYQESSPINVFQAVKQLTNNIEALIYKMTLIREEVYTLRKVNIAFSKRCKAKRTYI